MGMMMSASIASTKTAEINLSQENNKNIVNRKRALNEVHDVVDDEDDDQNDDSNEDADYPQVGIRATCTIKISKTLFATNHAFHFQISHEILLRAIQRISEFRWVHSKFNLKTEDIRYLIFINEQLNVPKEFINDKPKRGRPPKKKLRKKTDDENMNEHNSKVDNDKIYRLNFQIVFKKNVPQQYINEIIKCIKIDLNQNSLSLLLTNVISAKVDIMQKVQSYSVYAVNAHKLREYEKYEQEEEERKRKKRQREQLRRAKKKVIDKGLTK